MKIYIAGKITERENYKEDFKKAEELFLSQGHSVMNPSFLPPGFKEPEYHHICLRHTTATNALNAGASLSVVQKMLGHENPGTTQIYAELNNTEVHAEHRKHVA